MQSPAAQTAGMLDAPRESVSTRPPLIVEDWLSVIVGASLIALALAGARFTDPIQVSLLVLVPLTAGAALLGSRLTRFILGAVMVAALAWLAQAAAGLPMIATWSLEYVVFALAIGLIINRAISVPPWLREAVRTEYYIKTGLVVLGAGILADDIVRAGLLGVAQALVVVLSVWTFVYWLSRRLRVDDEFAAMLASAVSICGVSAAIAACGAIQGDRRKLSYVTSLVLVVAMPMMVLMPWLARWAAMPDVVAGAWLGGTLDTSAAVVAGGELISDAARDAAVVVKLSQNALIGVAAFLLTLWWTLYRDPGSERHARIVARNAPGRHLGALPEICLRIPDGVDRVLVAHQRHDGDRHARDVDSDSYHVVRHGVRLDRSGDVVGESRHNGRGRPALAFLGAQTFNIVVTLVAAYVFFGGFPFAP